MELMSKRSCYKLPSTSVHPEVTEPPPVVEITRDTLSNKRRRLVKKDGKFNVKYANIKRRTLRLLLDHFTTFIEQKWRVVIFVFFSCFFVSWFLFTLAWFGLASWHGDFGDNEPDFTPCIWNIKTFGSVFLFSIETQTTIGYGYRYVSEECKAGIFLLILQSVFGAMMQSLLAGSILAKIQIPRKRAKTVQFSKHCCVCMENGELCLMFRVGNLRHTPVVAGSVRVFFLRHDENEDEEDLAYELKEMQMDENEGANRVHLWWPCTLIHRITKSSPLYDISNKTLKTKRFEIIVVLAGSVACTGLSFEARTSYMENDIFWGYRFTPFFKPESTSKKYEVDYKNFDDIYPVPRTPKYCAKQLDENKNVSDVWQRRFCRSYNIVN